MTTSNSKDQWVDPLRQQAEERVSKPRTDVAKLSNGEIERLVYDMEVHKEELEIQNEELRQVQIQLQLRSTGTPVFTILPRSDM